MNFAKITASFTRLGETFSLAPFDAILQPLMDEVLSEQGQDHWRKGTLLIPRLLIWLVLVLTLRRDLNYDKALNWMVSGFRRLDGCLPAKARLVSDGTISHARLKLGVEVLRGRCPTPRRTAPPLANRRRGRARRLSRRCA